MRTSAILAAAFAATAFSSPLAKREVEVETVTDVVYVTDVVTETAGASTVASSSAVETAPSARVHFGHHTRHSSAEPSSTYVAPTSSVVPETTTAAPTTDSATSSAAEVSKWKDIIHRVFNTFKSSPVDESNAHLHHSSPTSSPPLEPKMIVQPRAASSSTKKSSSTTAKTTTKTTSKTISKTTSKTTSKPTSKTTSKTTSKRTTTKSTTKSTTKKATSTTAASASIASTYQEAVISHHNYHRANHSAANVVWNSTLASIAQEIAESCTYAHNLTPGGGGYGQNIAAGVQSGQIAEVVTGLFYNGEVNNYPEYGTNTVNMTNFENWGHFSQVVWKGTTAVGCYTQSCSTLANTGSNIPPYFTVCNYYPPGNYVGDWTQVGAPLDKATIEGTYNVASSLTGQTSSQ